MPACTGRGDTNGGHCCYIEGKVCEFLFVNRGGVPRCSIWDEMDSNKWRRSEVGKWFAKTYPGFNCQDWPQNIPEAMAAGRGLCCWNEPVEVVIS